MMRTLEPVRTTVNLDADVLAAVEERRRATGAGLSETVNELVREGLATTRPRIDFVNRPAAIGLRIDVTNIGDVLDLLDSDR